MRHSAKSSFVSLAVAVLLAGGPTCAAELSPAPQDKPDSQAAPLKPDAQAPQAKKDEPPPKTPAEERADLYARLAASKDADETAGIITLLLHLYSESGSDTADLLLRRARQAIGVENYSDALKILDATVAFLPDWAEGWNARATARYLDDDYNGSMADIAQTLKREPKHIGALMGMGMILEAREKREDALKVYERVLEIAPHWHNAQEAADKLKAALAGSEL
jgi:tetratricopeptide (TPR) repeat protein